MTKVGNKYWDEEEVKRMYENDFDTRKEWCMALGHSGGTHFKQLIKKFNLKEEDFGKNRKHIYKQKISIGDTFGKLTVVALNCEKDKYNRFKSKCLCDCGTELIVLNNSLLTGNTTSCGCVSGRDEKNKIKNGDIFGYLTVIDANNCRTNNNKMGSKCLCRCGEEIIVENHSLRSGNTTSCGCKNGNNKNNKIKNGDIFGCLTVISANSFHFPNNSLASKCKCSCGKEKYIRNHDLRSGATTTCGCKRESKGEQKIKKFLRDNNIIFKQQYVFPQLKGKNNGILPFDFAIFFDNKISYLIEFQGMQHYQPIDFFGGMERYEVQTANDSLKRDFCLKNNIELIEIPYTEIENLEEKYLKILIK